MTAFPRPWEKGARKTNPVVEDARLAASHKPWEPAVPKVEQRIIDQHTQRRQAQGENRRTIDPVMAQAFAKAYLIDFDHRNAALRVGLAGEDAEYARKVGLDYVRHPLVLQAIQAFMSKLEPEKVVTRDRVLFGLLQEANYFGVGSSHSARVAAWSKLAKILGMELPPEPEQTARGGVMLVPMAGGIDAWEAAAVGQQAQLKADVRT